MTACSTRSSNVLGGVTTRGSPSPLTTRNPRAGLQLTADWLRSAPCCVLRVVHALRHPRTHSSIYYDAKRVVGAMARALASAWIVPSLLPGTSGKDMKYFVRVPELQIVHTNSK